MALSILATPGEISLVLLIGLAFFGLAWFTMCKSFRRIVSHNHETQEKIDRLEGALLAALESTAVEVTSAVGHRAHSPRPASVRNPLASAIGHDCAPRREPVSSRVPAMPCLASWPDLGEPFCASRNGWRHAMELQQGHRLEPEQFMFTAGHEDQVILSYGCGQGVELVEFARSCKPRHLVGVDIMASALEKVREHLVEGSNLSVELCLLPEAGVPIPVDDHVFDCIRCSGTLQYAVPLRALFGEFARVLKENGVVHIGILNTDSVWWHLCVALLLTSEEVADVSRREESSQGKAAPSRQGSSANAPPASPSPYAQREVATLAEAAGFRAKKLGCNVSLAEMSVLGRRFEALANPTVADEHKKFLRALRFDDRGRPLHEGEVAGFETVYELVRV